MKWYSFLINPVMSVLDALEPLQKEAPHLLNCYINLPNFPFSSNIGTSATI
jgi:hypothetical protein